MLYQTTQLALSDKVQRYLCHVKWAGHFWTVHAGKHGTIYFKRWLYFIYSSDALYINKPLLYSEVALYWSSKYVSL